MVLEINDIFLFLQIFVLVNHLVCTQIPKTAELIMTVSAVKHDIAQGCQPDLCFIHKAEPLFIRGKWIVQSQKVLLAQTLTCKDLTKNTLSWPIKYRNGHHCRFLQSHQAPRQGIKLLKNEIRVSLETLFANTHHHF